MKPFITYKNSNNEIIDRSFLNDSEMAKNVFYDDNEGRYYFTKDPESEEYEDRCYLNSVNNQPAYYEQDYDRTHFMWNGLLHRINGPAFYCGKPATNTEFHAFGFWLDAEINDPQEFLNKHSKYLTKLQEYLEDFAVEPTEFDGIYTLSDWNNFIDSVNRGVFRWSRDGVEINLFDNVPGFEAEPKDNSGLGAFVGVAAISAVVLALSNKKTNKIKNTNKEYVKNIIKA